MQIFFLDVQLIMYDSLILIGVIGLNELNTKWVDKQGEKTCQKPLFDVLHESLPNLSEYEKMIDLFPAFLGFIVLCIVLTQNPLLNITVLLRQLWIVILLRIIMCRMTIFPSPICNNSRKSQAIGGCHDCMFSGHTSLTLLIAYHIYKCFPSTKYVLLSYCIICSLFIIVSRSHYTIDVVVAWLVVYSIILTMNSNIL